jgi:cytochrome c-type biogenesis protein CcmH/NrfF
VTSLASQTAPTQCPHDLEAKDAWIEAGFRCPATDTVQTLLSDCHCPIAHALKDRIKGELAQGKQGQEIRQTLIAEYGDRLKLRGGPALK